MRRGILATIDELKSLEKRITRQPFEPIYETLPGWDDDLTGIASFEDLPANARDYVRRIEEIVGQPVEMVGVGPKRSQTIVRA